MADEGVMDGAVLLLSIGEEEAAEVFKHLSPPEVQRLSEAMAKLTSVTRDKVEGVLDRFRSDSDSSGNLGVDANQYLRNVLTKALGDDRAGPLLERILKTPDSAGIEGLKWMDAGSVADLIKNEHPQIIASILAHLERDQACAVLQELADTLRNEVVLRIATLDRIKPQAMQELNEVLTKLLSGGTSRAPSVALGGARTAAEILNFISASEEAEIIDNLRQHDPELAQKILDEMFVFDNLLDLDDRGMQLLLREVQSESLVIALKGANEELREKVFKNMSQRAADMLREDLESKGPVKLSEVEAEQKEILSSARRLADEGQLNLGGRGDDQYV
jgi:flagellar motor switch protein FliG